MKLYLQVVQIKRETVLYPNPSEPRTRVRGKSQIGETWEVLCSGLFPSTPAHQPVFVEFAIDKFGVGTKTHYASGALIRWYFGKAEFDAATAPHAEGMPSEVEPRVTQPTGAPKAA